MKVVTFNTSHRTRFGKWIDKVVMVRACDDCGDLRGGWFHFPPDICLCETCAMARGLLINQGWNR